MKWYYGVKLHILGQKVYGTLPRMTMSQVTPADEHDLQAAKEMLSFVQNIILIADKVYCDSGWSCELKKQCITVYTPVKLEKGQEFLRSAERYPQAV
jgi:hypothetical protein